MFLKLRDTSLLFTLYRNRKLCANGNSVFLSLSETFRSVKNFFLVFLKRSEAWKTSFWSFWNVQKRLFSPFRAYVVDRSVYFLHFAFMSLSEAIIFFISCLCRWQKRWKNSFYLTEWCCSLKFLVLFPSNRKYRFQILFLKPTDRVEVGRDDVSIGMM